eukprot:scaffold2677_cov220-Pinguiococcus_pyrenoidosus.AAC.10
MEGRYESVASIPFSAASSFSAVAGVGRPDPWNTSLDRFRLHGTRPAREAGSLMNAPGNQTRADAEDPG